MAGSKKRRKSPPKGMNGYRSNPEGMRRYLVNEALIQKSSPYPKKKRPRRQLWPQQEHVLTPEFSADLQRLEHVAKESREEVLALIGELGRGARTVKLRAKLRAKAKAFGALPGLWGKQIGYHADWNKTKLTSTESLRYPLMDLIGKTLPLMRKAHDEMLRQLVEKKTSRVTLEMMRSAVANVEHVFQTQIPLDDVYLSPPRKPGESLYGAKTRQNWEAEERVQAWNQAIQDAGSVAREAR